MEQCNVIANATQKYCCIQHLADVQNANKGLLFTDQSKEEFDNSNDFDNDKLGNDDDGDNNKTNTSNDDDDSIVNLSATICKALLLTMTRRNTITAAAAIRPTCHTQQQITQFGIIQFQ